MSDDPRREQIARGELGEAFRRQCERAAESMRVNRHGWTDEQWCEDAERLMNEVDGAITSLVNGHVMALLRFRRSVLDQPTTEPPAEYEQVGWRTPDGKLHGLNWRLIESDWDPVYRRVLAPTEGANDE